MRKFRIPNIAEEKSALKTIRLKRVTLQKIEKLSEKNDMSVNKVFNKCIEFALENLNLLDFKKQD